MAVSSARILANRSGCRSSGIRSTVTPAPDAAIETRALKTAPDAQMELPSGLIEHRELTTTVGVHVEHARPQHEPPGLSVVEIPSFDDSTSKITIG
jgi:hypothetical protein